VRPLNELLILTLSGHSYFILPTFYDVMIISIYYVFVKNDVNIIPLLVCDTERTFCAAACHSRSLSSASYQLKVPDCAG